MQKVNITFFGNEKLATGVKSTGRLLQALLDNEHCIVDALILNSDKNRVFDEIELIANKQGIPILKVKTGTEIIDAVKNTHSDVGVLASFGQIIDEAVLKLFPRGILNIHPSLLPKYRGSTPIETALLDGTSHTGVSIMKLVKKMDAGPLLAQKQVAISEAATKQELHDLLLMEGIKLLLPVLTNPDSAETPQDGDPSYTKLIRKSDGLINWQLSAEQIIRQIRAYDGWPTSFASFQDFNIRVLSARSSTVKIPVGTLTVIDKKLLVGCSNGSIELITLQPAGKNYMSAQAFINGYRDKLEL